MIPLISLNKECTFDTSYSQNNIVTERKQSFIELTTTNCNISQEYINLNNINSPVLIEKTSVQNNQNDPRVRFYSVEPTLTDFNLSPRKLSVLYDDWVRDETNQNIHKPQNQFLQRYNRIYMMKKQDNGKELKEKNKFHFSVNLTQLMLAQMNVSKGLQNLLILNIVVDMIFRINFVALMIMAVVYHPEYLKTLLVFLYLPRVLHIFTMTKLLFLDKYDLDNKSILHLSHLVRSNFIEEDAYVNDNLHPQRRNSVFNVINIRSILFMVLPVELCIASLPQSTAFKRRTSIKTYILMTYILKGIEAILFQPVLLYLIVSKYYALNEVLANYPNVYENFTYLMVIGDISKYIFLSVLLLLRGNGQKKAIKQRMFNAIHQSTDQKF